MAYNAELQMLREVVRYFLVDERCHFCHKPFLLEQEITGLTFGHRRHTSMRTLLTIHHEDENRNNNQLGNLKLCHQVCHKRHHKEKRNAEESRRAIEARSQEKRLERQS